MKLKMITLMAIVTLVAGCATVGNKYDKAAVAQLTPGVTTMADAITTLGKPISKSVFQDGSILLQWHFAEVIYTSSKSTHHAVLFDENGIMLRVTLDSATNIISR